MMLCNPILKSMVCAAVAIVFSGCDDNSDLETLNQTVATSPLTIEPSSVTLASDKTVVAFVAIGGTPPYAWQVSDQMLGAVGGTSGSVATYTRAGEVLGANQVMVVDHNGWSASATVIHTQATTNSAL